MSWGKTQPIDRILLCAADGRYRTVRLNLVEPDRATIADLNKFLRWFCCRVTRLLTNGRKTTGDRFSNLTIDKRLSSPPRDLPFITELP